MSRAPALPPSASEAPALDSRLIERFSADVTRALGAPLAPGGVLGLAVSGGPDSMAMLALARTVLPGRIAVATVDHRLRAEGAGEAAMVARYCDELGVPHQTLVPDAPIAGASIQARARAVRYRLLGRWAREAGLAGVATAHHLDDQAETFLMRAARGSGVAGLGGIRVRQHVEGILLVRPLLGWPRALLTGVARDLPFVDDPSNTDDRHDRTRIRRLLAGADAPDAAGLARSAAILTQTDRDVRAVADLLWDERASTPAPATRDLDVARLPREMLRRLARRAIAEVRAEASIIAPAFGEAANIEPLLASLTDGRSATQAGVMVTPHTRMIWRFAAAPARRAH